MSESLDIQILSMDDKEMFGEVFFRYSFSKAISEGILSDYRVVVIGIDDISTRDLFNKRALVKAGVVETDSESLALHVALFKAMKNWNLRRIISFHSRVAKARKFANDQVVLNDWMPKQYAVLGKLNATTISSSMPTSKRRQILDVLKNLNEGENFESSLMKDNFKYSKLIGYCNVLLAYSVNFYPKKIEIIKNNKIKIYSYILLKEGIMILLNNKNNKLIEKIIYLKYDLSFNYRVEYIKKILKIEPKLKKKGILIFKNKLTHIKYKNCLNLSLKFKEIDCLTETLEIFEIYKIENI